MYAEPSARYGKKRDAFIYCGVNAYWEERTLELPIVPAGYTWQTYVYTADAQHDTHKEAKGSVSLAPRSLMVLVAE